MLEEFSTAPPGALTVRVRGGSHSSGERGADSAGERGADSAGERGANSAGERGRWQCR